MVIIRNRGETVKNMFLQKGEGKTEQFLTDKYLGEYQGFLNHLSQIKQEWECFSATGKTDQVKNVRPEVLSSWIRCHKVGVDPYKEGVSDALDAKKLAAKIEENLELIEAASPFLESLASNLAGTGFRVDLFDRDLYLLKQFGEEEAIQLATKRGSVLGACRNEASNGTNAINLAAILGQPIQLAGPEHYNAHSHIWTCSATPVFAENGDLLGVINVAGHFSKVHDHTLGMVIALGKAIEFNLRQQRLYRQKVLAVAYMENIVNSITDGLVAVDEQGDITLINDTAGSLLDVLPEEALHSPAGEIMGEQSTLLDVLKNGEAISDKELAFYRKNKRRSAIGNVVPIINDNKVEGALAVFRGLSRARSLVKNVAGFNAYFTFNDLIGSGNSFVQAVNLARQAAVLPSNMLLMGESGTGKELFAQASHNAGSVSDGPFVGINCAAIPAELIESELFGYEGGAFTGARQDGKPGKFQLAKGGTLFLDEINSMPVTMQAKLLRVLQNRSFSRVGGVQEIPFQARVIAATNQDLWEEVSNGNFREDLFYRLNVITIEIPPLREHREDIAELARYFCEKLSEKFSFRLYIAQQALEVLQVYHWPGNVRELENVIERCAVLAYSRGSHSVEKEDLLGYPGIRQFFEQGGKPKIIRLDNREESPLRLEQLEKEAIEEALMRTQGNISRASKELGITRKTLYKKMEKYTIEIS
ncbi:sigma-54-dependent Fis family transcriptional regulator [Dethiobacter alkaliphilus]|uniref:sigma-54-dependent Fis family transcriptional regulator n=1 Tax=Dethiobacter alkaliphilus TaxID=427926 RepID=UPI002225E65C|nr:sigma 54-interacting transcriptional regulator [Dethiobacter alkaliphilus]MCW3489008.1 sigma 54-interacting transcriptional regulator [Dethiobacter alkaliphilus]